VSEPIGAGASATPAGGAEPAGEAERANGAEPAGREAANCYPFLLAGELRSSPESREIRAPFDGAVVGRAALASADEVRQAILAAAAAAPETRALSSYRRSEFLRGIREALAARRDELAELLTRESGKPIRTSRGEVDRSLFVFEVAAEEAGRTGGELFPLDRVPAAEGRWAITRRFPLAPISAIIPFNYPILLAAHKIAPAIACGATMVLKPPPQDPLTTLILAEVLAEVAPACGYPAGALSLLPCEVEDAEPLLTDAHVRMVTFTGSAKVGWHLRRLAGKRKVALELGGNAGVIVEPDADLGHAARRCAFGGYTYAGQSCISTQRILAHADIRDEFVERFVAEVGALCTGDPMDEATDVGPLIDEANVERAIGWIEEAVAAGARIAVGGGRTGSVIQPTVLLDTRPDMRVNCEEVFAPVTTVRSYDDFGRAIAEVNDTPYGLQAGVFTHDIRRIRRAFEGIEVGGLVINDVSGFRVDHMPYGGVKDSGRGREGLRYAIEEMTEMRLLVV